jgi:FkbM family methyltransferase
MLVGKLFRVCDHTFYLADDDAKIVVDLGMNKGEFSEWFVNNTNARCYGVEPVPQLYQCLPRNDRIAVLQVAVGGASGRERLSVPEHSCASLTSTGLLGESQSIEIEVITLASFLRKYGLGRIDILKIDIEGAELDVLRSLDADIFANVGQMTIEFHDFIKPGDRPAVRQILADIKDKGFFVMNFGRTHFTDVMCLNEKWFKIGLSLKTQFFFMKYMRGTMRLIRRLRPAPTHAAKLPRTA